MVRLVGYHLHIVCWSGYHIKMGVWLMFIVFEIGSVKKRCFPRSTRTQYDGFDHYKLD